MNDWHYFTHSVTNELILKLEGRRSSKGGETAIDRGDSEARRQEKLRKRRERDRRRRADETAEQKEEGLH